jgi:peptidoglycan/LPS O-acetylase OafA/YrhL
MFDLSVLMYFVLMALYLAVSGLAVRSFRFYEDLVSPAKGSRYESLDGLRGILATSVFIHHAVVMQRFQVTGKWIMPTNFYAYLGPVPVDFFFMITGFLFWSRAIRCRGRIAAVPLWSNRLLRIAPMCLFTVLLMFAIAAVESQFRLRVPLRKLVPQILGCLSLGLFLPRLNGVDLLRVNAGVFWTLRFEWSFYVWLPLVALCATPRRLAVLCAAAVPVMVFAESVTGDPRWNLFTYFLLGMIAAQLVAARRLARFFQSVPWTLAGIAASAILAALCPGRYGMQVLMFVVFAAITYDSRLAAFLRWQSTKFLGTISYSIYLMHGIALFIVYSAVKRAVRVDELSPQAFWGICGCCGLLTIAVSAVTYRFVEHPFLSSTLSAKRTPTRVAAEVQTLGATQVSGGIPG